MNKLMLLGHVGKDPELRHTQSGVAVCNFSIATNAKEKQGAEYVDVTEWTYCTAFGKRAEALAQHARKGSQLFVEGRKRTRKYTDRDNNERTAVECIVENFEFVGKRDAVEPTSAVSVDDIARAAASYRHGDLITADSGVVNIEINVDDIPF